jgi:hypothetical protein
VSLLSQYRLKAEIGIMSIEGLPDNEYTPGNAHGKFIDVYWEGRLYRVRLADVFQHAEFIGSK